MARTPALRDGRRNVSRLVSAYLALFAVASSAGARDAGEGDTGRALSAGGNASLVRVLIDRGVALGRETEPLKKAEHFEMIVGELAERVRRAARTRRHERAHRFAEHFRRIAERGVAANIEEAAGGEATGIEHAVRAHAERMRRHEEVLERVVAGSPEAARAGLRRAIEASRHGRLRAMERLRWNLARRRGMHHGKRRGEPGGPHAGGHARGRGRPGNQDEGADEGHGRGKGGPDDVASGRGPGPGHGRGAGPGGGPPEGKRDDEEDEREKKGPPEGRGHGRGHGGGGRGGSSRGRGRRGRR